MSDNSAIEWTEASWNPVTGCTKVSPGCDHCYAETFAERFRGVPGHHFENGFDVQLREDKLTLPLRWRKPRRIFANSMSDLFHDAIPDEYIARVFAVMAATPHHTYQLLTKRHARMRSLLSRGTLGTCGFPDDVEEAMADFTHASLDAWPLPNVWLGVSVEDQKWADIRVPALLATPAAVRWLSCEPLLGPVNLRDCAGLDAVDYLDWVVVGGESGPGARPMHPDWARSLRDQCTRAGTSYFFKQFGEYGELPANPRDLGVTVANDGTVYQPGDLAWPDGLRAGEAIRAGHDKAHLHAMYRVGKKRAGRELDGRTWDEYPTVTAEAVAA